MWKIRFLLTMFSSALLSVHAWADERRSNNRPGPKAAAAELRPLFDAIRQVETGGVAKPHDAVGDRGRSLGPYQISQAYWRDSGVRGDWRRCRKTHCAEAAMIAYWERYCPQALRARDFRTLARVHNGGPKGNRKAATERYWAAVQAHL